MMDEKVKGASLSLDRASKYFSGFLAVEDATMEITPGEFVSFLGPSGSGKTTSLNMIAGFETPSSGDISLDGKSLVNIPISHRNIGMVFQGYALFPHLSVEANIAYPLKQRKMGRSERAARVNEVIEKVGLTEFRQRMPAQLSGGQRQRVALARAIAYQPPLLLMDEPLSALDKGLREHLQQEIRSIHKDLGTTVIYVTHDQDEALALSDRIVVFNKGRIEQIGTPDELYTHPDNLFVAKFLGESLLLTGEIFEGVSGAQYFRAGSLELPILNSRGVSGKARLMIRPEKVEMSRLAPKEQIFDGRARVSAVVNSSTYLGHTSRYLVSVGQVGGGTVRISNQVTAEDMSGMSVTLSWAVEDAIPLPDEYGELESKEDSEQL